MLAWSTRFMTLPGGLSLSFARLKPKRLLGQLSGKPGKSGESTVPPPSSGKKQDTPCKFHKAFAHLLVVSPEEYTVLQLAQRVDFSSVPGLAADKAADKYICVRDGQSVCGAVNLVPKDK